MALARLGYGVRPQIAPAVSVNVNGGGQAAVVVTATRDELAAARQLIQQNELKLAKETQADNVVLRTPIVEGSAEPD